MTIPDKLSMCFFARSGSGMNNDATALLQSTSFHLSKNPHDWLHPSWHTHKQIGRDYTGADAIDNHLSWGHDIRELLDEAMHHELAVKVTTVTAKVLFGIEIFNDVLVSGDGIRVTCVQIVAI